MELPLTDIDLPRWNTFTGGGIYFIVGIPALLTWFGGPNRLTWVLGTTLFNACMLVIIRALPQLEYHDVRWSTLGVALTCALICAALWVLTYQHLLTRLEKGGMDILRRIPKQGKKALVVLGFVPLALVVSWVVFGRQPERTIVVVSLMEKNDERRATL